MNEEELESLLGDLEINNNNKQCFVKLKYFVTKFVCLCDCALSVYWDRLQNKTEKPGKWADMFSKVKIGKGTSKLLLLGLQEAVKKFGARENRSKLKKLLGLLYKYEADPDFVKIVLIKSAVEIFICYENQFVHAFADKCWQRAIEKIAVDAVTRLLGCVEEISEKFSTVTVIKCFIQGKSKTTIIQSLTGSDGGRSIKYNNAKIKTSSLFEKPGLVSIEDDNCKYYERKDQKNIGFYGYRLLFRWELLATHDNQYKLLFHNDVLIDSYYHKTQPPKEEYKYILKQVDRSVFENKLLKEISKSKIENDVNEFLDVIKSFFDQISVENLIENLLKDPKIANLTQEYIKRNQPIEFGIRDPIDSYLERENKIEKVIGDNIKDQIVIISGLGGVGKTELALQYAQEKENSNVLLINSKTYADLHESFKELNCLIKKTNQEASETDEKTIKKISKEVYDYFKNKDCLFIFDDVQEDVNIITFLPSKNPRHHILITTPKHELVNQQERYYKEIKLDCLTKPEAKTFIERYVKINDDQLNQLINLLHPVLPLALQYVVSFIKKDEENNVNFIIDSLQNEYSEKLKYIFEQKPFALYNKSVIFIINNTIEKIRESQNPFASIAIQILDLIAYFAPHNIPKNIFLPLIENECLSHQFLSDAVSLLKEFAIVNVKQNKLLNVHQLLQTFIRLQNQNEEQILAQALDLLKMTDPDSYKPHILSVWKHASKYKDLKLKYLLTEVDYTTFLHLIAEHSFEILEIVLDNIDSDMLEEIVSKKRKDGKTLLHCAALSGNIKSVKLLLLEQMCNVNAVDELLYTPLHLAAEYGYEDVVALLLQSEADFEKCTHQGLTAIHLASKNNHPLTVEEIMTKINDINSAKFCDNKYNHTPLHLAAKRGHEECVKILLGNGASIYARTDENFTALHYAAQNGHINVVEEILKKATNIDSMCQMKTNEKKMPLELAKENNHFNIVELLSTKANNREIHSPDNK